MRRRMIPVRGCSIGGSFLSQNPCTLARHGFALFGFQIRGINLTLPQIVAEEGDLGICCIRSGSSAGSGGLPQGQVERLIKRVGRSFPKGNKDYSPNATVGDKMLPAQQN